MSSTRSVVGAAACGLATFLLVSACTDGPDEPAVALQPCEAIPKDHPDRDALAAIDAMSLCGSSAVDIGDAYIVEGDIRISKASLTDKQARTPTLVSTANVRTITVHLGDNIPEDGGVDDWRDAYRTAIDVWNAVPFAMVRMEYAAVGPADITVLANAGLGDGALGDATLPANGQPGTNIFVNLRFEDDRVVTESEKVRSAVHELGHCIGLRHTNWVSEGESGAVHINGTPQTDNASVMNGGQAGTPFTGLTANDRLALRLIYPEIVTLMIEYTGCTNGRPRMATMWGGTLSLPVIEWQLDRNVGGTWSQVYRGTGQDWTFNVATGTSLQLRVRGRSSEGWSMHRNLSRTAPSCNTPTP